MNTKKIAIIGVLIALSVVGSFLVVPSPAGTVAFVSLPGYVAAGLFGPIIGGIVGSLGHLINAGVKSFALGIPSHLIIAGFMFLAMAVYGFMYKKNKILAIVLATLVNGPLSLVPFYFMVGPGFAIGMIVPLTVASLANTLLATLIIPSLKKVTNE
jgi:uncharacterized membrane protein